MSREAHIAKYVQKALMDAALELWKDEVAAEREIFRKIFLKNREIEKM